MTNVKTQGDQVIWSCSVLFLCGVASWDVLTTLWFDWEIITGKRRWKWPMVFYFIARICILWHLWLYVFDLNPIFELPCQNILYALKVPDLVGRTSARIILVLRTYAIWRQDKRVGIPLALGTVGQTVIWSQFMRFSSSRWDPVQGLCLRLATVPSTIVIAYFSYTIVLDFSIVALAVWKLVPRAREDGIGSLLLCNGIVYFIAVLLGNLVALVLEVLQLDPIISLGMGLPISLVVSVIASTAVFRHSSMYYQFSQSLSSSNQAVVSAVRINTPGVSARLDPSGSLHGQGHLTRHSEITAECGELPITVTQTINIKEEEAKPTPPWDYDRQATRAQAVVTFEETNNKSVSSVLEDLA